jgi:TPR repeat protein
MLRTLLMLFCCLLFHPLFSSAQDKPRAALAPVAALGDISDAQRTLIYNSLRGELSSKYDLVSASDYDDAEAQAFSELEAEECTAENCVRLVQEFLQLENLFVLQLTEVNRLFQISLTEYLTGSNRTVTNECSSCSANELLSRIRQVSRNFIYSEAERLVELNQLLSNPAGPSSILLDALQQFSSDYPEANLEQIPSLSPIAQRNLGIIYREGRGVPTSDEKAVLWFTKSANQGDLLSMTRLGFLHFYGKGTTQSFEQALTWYRKAAERGHGPAQFNLASMYRKGQGTDANEEEAINWYRKAASNGMNAQAQKVLAWMGAN